jgi:uncharacterized membrane protein YagU involved in acid resistance
MTTQAAVATEKPRALAAITSGGLIAGSFDLTFALVFNGLRGVRLIRIPQSIASGLLGMRAFSGGIPTAALGVGLHYVIALGAAVVYYIASRRLAFLRSRAVICGMVYGALIYLFMNFVVLPLSAAPKFRHTVFSTTCDLIVHVMLIGLSIALAVRKFGGAPE